MSKSTLRCEQIAPLVHRRAELTGAVLRSFNSHISHCERCQRTFLETERLEELWHRWEPEPTADVADRVVAILQGAGPQTNCQETQSELHHFISQDLLPWRSQRIETHLANCRVCQEHHEEATHSRQIWLTWKAPDPAPDNVERVDRRLRTKTERQRPVLRLLLGEVRMPRYAAALVFLAVMLAVATSVQQLLSEDPRPTSSVAESSGVVSDRSMGLFTVSAGHFDTSDVFSSAHHKKGRGGLLRRAMD